MSQEHDDAKLLYDRINQARANNGGTITKEEWLRIVAENMKAVRDAERALPKTKRVKGQRDPLFDALAAGCGLNLNEITRYNGRAVGVALASIRTATPDVTPEEIALRITAYKRAHATWALTPPAIAKHWPTLGTGRATAVAAANDPRILKGEPKGWQQLLQAKIDAYHLANPGYNCDIEMYLAEAKKGGFRSLPERWQLTCWKELTP